ncbi:hypothetical protein LTR47_009923 [Exophiala xenobiotica]|nr:hypothetical protein LTR47_009923 [Exophiala xenobiotica]KAK5250332.1 hypothetical protein LTS06_004910 [Exophiala xenobiotica]KAK5284245.1 hypothetical protein LTR40_000523 [Exophiala xenobiotica]KAK5345791.1 hypothetical protein LTR61_010492 [Exophiala xenobiotica]KAK5359178.1 hypothetical protein LTR11_010606 [Exophiala xenobiotica]
MKEYPKDKLSVAEDREPFHAGSKPHMHDDLDSNSTVLAHRHQASEEVQKLKKDPTLPAIMHGHQPSKGAKIDKKIQEEEDAQIT